MKKYIYALASLAILAGCAKEATLPEQASPVTIDLTLTVDETATKTAYDGDSHIKWLAGDAISVIIDTKENSQSHSGAYKYASFTIDSDLEHPQFKGSMSLMDDQALEEMWVYGFYPFSANVSANDCAIHGKKVILPATQTYSSGSWDGQADVMAIKPVKLGGTPGGTTGYYSWASTVPVQFAHIFGFGCLDFSGISADKEFSTEEVKKIIITSTSEGKPLAGNFKVNLETDVTLEENAAVLDGNGNTAITLVPSESVALNQTKARFVAAPGNYDVDITVLTTGHKLSFHREGLVIERAKIASPVITWKTTDVESSTNVTVNGTWKHNFTDAYTESGNKQFFIRNVNSVDWGTSDPDKRMEMNLTYAGASDPANYYGTPQNRNGVYNQDFNYSAGKNLTGVTIQVSSSAQFVGMKVIKVNAGDYKAPNYSGVASVSKIAVFVSDANGKHQLGESQTVTGSTDSRKGTDYYFTVPAEMSTGVLTVELSDFSQAYACPYIGELEINPVPGILLGGTSASYLSAASEGSFSCNVISASSDPSVETDASWIHASYADGTVSYTVDQNTTNENRSGKIIISASNENGSSSAEYTISQFGAQYKSYTVELNYDTIKEALLSAGAEDAEAGKISASATYSFEIETTAKAADGTTATVKLNCQNIRYKESVENSAICVYGGGTYGRITNTTPVYAITSANVTVADGQDAPLAKFGKTSGSMSEIKMNKTGENEYVCMVAESDTNAYFQLGAGSYSYKSHFMKSITISFINE